jgi:hypothetical protein
MYGGGLHRQLSTDIAFIVHCLGTHDHLKFITSSHRHIVTSSAVLPRQKNMELFA